MEWYLKVIKNYTGFCGRARRKEYWMFVLFNLIFLLIAAIIDNILGITFEINNGFGTQNLPYGYIYLLYSLVVLIPGLAVSVRRLHDVGKSGWFMLIVLIPIIGVIWLLVVTCKDSNVGENEYGQNPKDVA